MKHIRKKRHIWVDAHGTWVNSSQLKGSRSKDALQYGYVFVGLEAWVSAGYWTVNETESSIRFLRAIYDGQERAAKLNKERKSRWSH
jgi:hypothetical protein